MDASTRRHIYCPHLRVSPHEASKTITFDLSKFEAGLVNVSFCDACLAFVFEPWQQPQADEDEQARGDEVARRIWRTWYGNPDHGEPV